MKPVQVATEEEQIRLLQNGDDRILQVIYRQYYQTIVNLVMNNSGSLQEAKDIYQETLIIFYEKVKDENFELNCKLKTYLYSISRNLWLKQLQHKKRFTNSISDSEEYLEIPWEEAGKKEDQYQAMHTALESLGEPCRSILKDFYMHSQSMEEITEKFGYTNADNAKNQKYKCLKRLKKVFFDSYGNDGGLNYDEQT
ncbi:MAG: sigma-70 family RNA polymerase sigma factor [Bacteroidia bacterium]|nr:sigma-70 family RNA polymerase sigma factor [Bacteroidia bacterium]MBP7244078.1 sigma-70 family RNA polymerase sigma factor [Bacteroidia bacterium]